MPKKRLPGRQERSCPAASVAPFAMHPRADELIGLLRLEPHPEGGHFVETFRSPLVVMPSDSRDARPALTVIYFLLGQNGVSRWHKVISDEAWHWYEGYPLELFIASPDTGVVRSTVLGPLSGSAVPQRIVPAGHWQSARTTGGYALVGCSVGPGFDYSDFTLLASVPEKERPDITPNSLLAELL